MVGRLAESEDQLLFATYAEVEKCEFIKMNATKEAWETWSSADDGAGLLLKADALREQARAVLVSAPLRTTTSPPMPGSSPPHPPLSLRPAGGAHRGDGGTCGNEGACGGVQKREDPGESFRRLPHSPPPPHA